MAQIAIRSILLSNWTVNLLDFSFCPSPPYRSKNSSLSRCCSMPIFMRLQIRLCSNKEKWQFTYWLMHVFDPVAYVCYPSFTYASSCVYFSIGMLCFAAKAWKSSLCIRFWPPGSLKAIRFPFSIHRNTVSLHTPQCLATVPVVRYSGYFFFSPVFKLDLRKCTHAVKLTAQALKIFTFIGLLTACYVIHVVKPVNQCYGI